jgi:hypothetical protein
MQSLLKRWTQMSWILLRRVPGKHERNRNCNYFLTFIYRLIMAFTCDSRFRIFRTLCRNSRYSCFCFRLLLLQLNVLPLLVEVVDAHTSKLPHFLESLRTDGGGIVSLECRPPSNIRNIPCNRSSYRLSRLRGHNMLEEWGNLGNTLISSGDEVGTFHLAA